MHKCVGFGPSHAFLWRPWIFPHALGCGARRGPTCTPRGKFGSRAGSGARALGVQNREIWQVISGLIFAELESSMTMENPHVNFFRFCSDTPRQNNTRFKLSPFLEQQTLLCVCGHCLVYVCCLCATCLRGCAGLVCAYMCWNPTFQLVFFSLLLVAPAVRITSSVSHRLSSSQALYVWQPRCDNSRTSSSPYCDGHGRCISLCVRVRETFPVGMNT